MRKMVIFAALLILASGCATLKLPDCYDYLVKTKHEMQARGESERHLNFKCRNKHFGKPFSVAEYDITFYYLPEKEYCIKMDGLINGEYFCTEGSKSGKGRHCINWTDDLAVRWR